jgi:cytochrome c oxidase assembly protein subunit 17
MNCSPPSLGLQVSPGAYDCEFPKKELTFNEQGKPIDSTGKQFKPCCVCPETKQARDNCILVNGEEECQSFIERHRSCLRSYGFKLN